MHEYPRRNSKKDPCQRVVRTDKEEANHQHDRHPGQDQEGEQHFHVVNEDIRREAGEENRYRQCVIGNGTPEDQRWNKVFRPEAASVTRDTNTTGIAWRTVKLQILLVISVETPIGRQA